ncbi:MAG TPA: alpha-1,4-glucan--maltose-1-phosphate maltosyltransferase [Gaiellaceae bacterium]|nr:alpha-1,4-glucan--maltose-1-phosphate maltosyltransferase [Gaiellaceae bacterium]
MPLPKTKPPRIQIEDVWPQIDCGRYPVKRSVGEDVEVWATIFRDGHDVLGAAVLYRGPGEEEWREAPMQRDVEPDRWTGTFTVGTCGRWEFTVQAWVDRFESWRDELRRKVEAGQADLASELQEGAALLARPELDVQTGLAGTESDRSEVTQLVQPLVVDADRVRARFGSWYELFPRSFGGFAGVAKVLPRIAELGFDVVYFPPIHPIGHTNRKGPNNALDAEAGDPGSPWAIGSEEGGHTAVHPELGTLDDFDRLVARAREAGIEIALDFAIQCSPDHPWLKEHPDWFHRRPDGTLKYAENPPKRYQDIYNVNFESEDWEGLWAALRDVVLFWVGHGVKVFRVDNPHTKPLPFWEWLISEVRTADAEVVFLSEAFTRPPMMAALAKAGFSQSYTYFTWKNTKGELIEYMTQITRSTLPEFFRPNFFANTPDILHEYLQRGGRPAFEARLVLAATLSPSYGIYSGYEHFENVPVREGSEEYLNSEKYEAKPRDLDGPLLPLVERLNRVRRENPALQRVEGIDFLETESEHLIAYARRVAGNVLLVCVNLDPRAEHEGVVVIPVMLGLPPAFAATELLTDEEFHWRIGRNYVRLGPGQSHVLRVETK